MTCARAIPLLLLAAASTASAAPLALKFEQAVYQDARETPLLRPEGVACGEGGAVVVADTGNGRLLTYSMKDGRLAGGTELKLAQLTAPVRVELARDGSILALDARSRRIVRASASGAYLGFVEPKGFAGASAVVPASFKLDAAGNVLLLDGPGRRVLVLDRSGAVSRQIPLPKTGEFMDVAVDAAGTVYALDGVGAMIWVALAEAKAFAPLTASLKDRMSFPTHLATSKGKLFVVDQHGHGIVAIGIDGSFMGRQLGTGWSDGLVYYPSQLCLTDAGDVIVTDRYNSRVQYFTVGK